MKSNRTNTHQWGQRILVGTVAAAAATGFLGLRAEASESESDGGNTAARDPTPAIEEIIVTAQKRAERVQDIPISITAIGEGTLKATGSDRIEDITDSVPGLSFTPSSTNPRITMRGIAASNIVGTTQQPVGIFIDDYPALDSLGSFTVPDLRLFDVNRVEVLRGPQGTLFGASALAGLIRIITNKPDLGAFASAIEVNGSTIADGEEGYGVSAMLNAPIVQDTLGARLVGYSRRIPGYVNNITRGEEDVNGGRSDGGRFYLAARPMDQLTVTLGLTVQHDRTDDLSNTFYTPPAGVEETESSFGTTLAEGTKRELTIGSLAVDYDLSWASLSLKGVVARDELPKRMNDATGYSRLVGINATTPALSRSETDTWGLEWVLTSRDDGPLRYVAGLYYNSKHRNLGQFFTQPALIPVFGTSNLLTNLVDIEQSEAAAFGELTYSWAPEWETTLGLRAFRNEFRAASRVSGVFNALQTSVADVPNDDESVTPKLSISYLPSSDLRIYATVAQGYRFGLINLTTVGNVPKTYDSDSLWSYELGLKTTQWDGRLVLDAAAYYIDWQDMQVNLRNVFAYTDNAGSSRAIGFEFSGAVQITDPMTFSTAVSLNNTELTADSPYIQQANGVVGAKKGDRAPAIPEFTIQSALQYQFDLTQTIGGTLRLEHQYVGSSYTEFTASNSLRLGDFNVVNARVSFQRGPYELDLHVNNIADDRGLANAGDDYQFLGFDSASRIAPRTIGATFRASF